MPTLPLLVFKLEKVHAFYPMVKEHLELTSQTINRKLVRLLLGVIEKIYLEDIDANMLKVETICCFLLHV